MQREDIVRRRDSGHDALVVGQESHVARAGERGAFVAGSLERSEREREREREPRRGVLTRGSRVKWR
jgi:hypothetical protein